MGGSSYSKRLGMNMGKYRSTSDNKQETLFEGPQKDEQENA